MPARRRFHPPRGCDWMTSVGTKSLSPGGRPPSRCRLTSYTSSSEWLGLIRILHALQDAGPTVLHMLSRQILQCAEYLLSVSLWLLQGAAARPLLRAQHPLRPVPRRPRRLLRALPRPPGHATWLSVRCPLQRIQRSVAGPGTSRTGRRARHHVDLRTRVRCHG